MRTPSSIASILIHAAILLALLGVFARAPRIAPYQLPGTAQGLEHLTYYAAGSVPHPDAQLNAKTAALQQAAARLSSPIAPPKAKAVTTPTGETGSASDNDAGLGDGNIRIALQKYFPYPRPDLSTLPKGASGDVVLDAVVDQTGRITQLTVVKSLGPAIDNAVIATVQGWTYEPATKNGVPVPSEQELHFHYERGWGV